MIPKVYVIGALNNPEIVKVGNALRAAGFNAFDAWYGAGEQADLTWEAYERERGRSYAEALYGDAATNIYEFDKKHLDASQMAVLVQPCGRSGHLEAGYMVGCGKPVFALFPEEPAKWDVMTRFLTSVSFDIEELIADLAEARAAIEARHSLNGWRAGDDV